MKTAFYTHPDFELHFNGDGHPERPQRLKAIADAVRAAGLWDELAHPQFESASDVERGRRRAARRRHKRGRVFV